MGKVSGHVYMYVRGINIASVSTTIRFNLQLFRQCDIFCFRRFLYEGRFDTSRWSGK